MRLLVCLSIVLSISTYISPTFAYDICFQQAGAEYRVSPELLKAISSHESNNTTAAVNMNSNGTYDIGLMQINSLWKKHLRPETWARITEPCVNIRVGAWILSQCVRDFGYGWDAVGCYHSRTPSKRDWYARRIAAKIYQANYASPTRVSGIQTGDIASFSPLGHNNDL